MQLNSMMEDQGCSQIYPVLTAKDDRTIVATTANEAFNPIVCTMATVANAFCKPVYILKAYDPVDSTWKSPKEAQKSMMVTYLTNLYPPSTNWNTVTKWISIDDHQDAKISLNWSYSDVTALREALLAAGQDANLRFKYFAWVPDHPSYGPTEIEANLPQVEWKIVLADPAIASQCTSNSVSIDSPPVNENDAAQTRGSMVEYNIGNSQPLTLPAHKVSQTISTCTTSTWIEF